MLSERMIARDIEIEIEGENFSTEQLNYKWQGCDLEDLLAGAVSASGPLVFVGRSAV
jgi:hypothetical protein